MVSYKCPMIIYFKSRGMWGKPFTRKLENNKKSKNLFFSLVLTPNTLPDGLYGYICSLNMYIVIMVSYRGPMTIYFKIRYIWGKHFIIFSWLDLFFKIQLFFIVLYPNTLPDELCGSICSYYMHNIINGIIQMLHDHLFQKSGISGKPFTSRLENKNSKNQFVL